MTKEKLHRTIVATLIISGLLCSVRIVLNEVFNNGDKSSLVYL